MDPELKARLRGLEPGSREYQAAIAAWNREQAARREQESRLAREQEGARAEELRRREQAEREEAARIRAERAAAEERSSTVTTASSTGGLAAGIGGGYLANRYATPRYRGEMSARGAQISELAGLARRIDPYSPTARAQYADITATARRGRYLRRPLPVGTGTTGLTLAGLGAYSTLERVPEAKSDIERGLWTGMGYGELAAAAELAAGSLHRYFNPGVAYPAQDVAAIEGARRMAEGGPLGPLAGSQPPDAAAARAARQTALMGSTGDVLKQRARELKLPVSGTKTALATRILDHEDALMRGETPAPPRTGRVSRAARGLLPLLAGGLAYDAATSGAEAAELTPGERRTRGLVAGGTAAGVTAGVPYALEKAAPAMARTMLGRAALRALPPVTGALGAFERGQQEAQPGSWFSSGSGYMQPNYPLLPEDYSERAATAQDTARIAADREAQAQRMPLMRASAIEIPENIPAGATAGADRQGALQANLDRLLAAIDEHNQSIAPPPGRNPAVQYEFAQ